MVTPRPSDTPLQEGNAHEHHCEKRSDEAIFMGKQIASRSHLAVAMTGQGIAKHYGSINKRCRRLLSTLCGEPSVQRKRRKEIRAV